MWNKLWNLGISEVNRYAQTLDFQDSPNKSHPKISKVIFDTLLSFLLFTALSNLVVDCSAFIINKKEFQLVSEIDKN